MDSDSDSPFNYSWPSFPKMRMRRKLGKKGITERYSDKHGNLLWILSACRVAVFPSWWTDSYVSLV